MRRATPGDTETVAGVLALAFEADPVAGFLFPEPERRVGALTQFFVAQLRYNYLPRGEVYVVEDCRAAALWMPPGSGAPNPWERLAQLLMFPIGAARFIATRRLAKLLAAHHPLPAHYYLGTIGTEPALQGKGLGSELLQGVLDRCDRGQLPAYLECSCEDNVSFYSRHGFRVTGEVSAPAGGPRLWLMWREPLRPL